MNGQYCSRMTSHNERLDTVCTVGIIAGASDMCSIHDWSQRSKEWQGGNENSLSVRLPSMVKVFPLPVAPLQAPQAYVPSSAGATYQHTQWAVQDLISCVVCVHYQLPMHSKAKISGVLQAVTTKETERRILWQNSQKRRACNVPTLWAQDAIQVSQKKLLTMPVCCHCTHPAQSPHSLQLARHAQT